MLTQAHHRFFSCGIKSLKKFGNLQKENSLA